MTPNELYNKVIRVIDSCNNLEQLKCGRAYMRLALKALTQYDELSTIKLEYRYGNKTVELHRNMPGSEPDFPRQ
jgi:hypothetical protein